MPARRQRRRTSTARIESGPGVGGGTRGAFFVAYRRQPAPWLSAAPRALPQSPGRAPRRVPFRAGPGWAAHEWSMDVDMRRQLTTHRASRERARCRRPTRCRRPGRAPARARHRRPDPLPYPAAVDVRRCRLRRRWETSRSSQAGWRSLAVRVDAERGTARLGPPHRYRTAGLGSGHVSGRLAQSACRRRGSCVAPTDA
jgi:hypothetical protein